MFLLLKYLHLITRIILIIQDERVHAYHQQLPSLLSFHTVLINVWHGAFGVCCMCSVGLCVPDIVPVVCAVCFVGGCTCLTPCLWCVLCMCDPVPVVCFVSAIWDCMCPTPCLWCVLYAVCVVDAWPSACNVYVVCAVWGCVCACGGQRRCHLSWSNTFCFIPLRQGLSVSLELGQRPANPTEPPVPALQHWDYKFIWSQSLSSGHVNSGHCIYAGSTLNHYVSHTPGFVFYFITEFLLSYTITRGRVSEWTWDKQSFWCSKSIVLPHVGSGDWHRTAFVILPRFFSNTNDAIVSQQRTIS